MRFTLTDSATSFLLVDLVIYRRDESGFGAFKLRKKLLGSKCRIQRISLGLLTDSTLLRRLQRLDCESTMGIEFGITLGGCSSNIRWIKLSFGRQVLHISMLNAHFRLRGDHYRR